MSCSYKVSSGRIVNRSLVFIVSFLALGLVGTQANDGDEAGGGDGVRMFGQSFANMQEYVESETFRNNGGRCGFDMAAPRARAFGRESLTQPQANPVGDCTASLTQIKNKYEFSNEIVIKIWFHVIQRTNGTGAISDTRINDQMDALNEDFLALSGTLGSNGYPTHIRFELAGITRTTNDEWYTDSVEDEEAYKQALGKNQDKFLNVYSNDADGFLGYAYYPTGGTAGQWYDGVTILSASVGGRNNGFSFYDQGRTLTHEIGHYLGLIHTFGDTSTCGNSFSSGDLIVDTPAESTSYDNTNPACPSTTSCGGTPAIANYMNYNRDSCMDNFTSQQSNRMICSLLTYRPLLGNVIINSVDGTTITPIYDLLIE